MIYIVNVSGGLTSFEALRRTIERYGTAQTVAVFADVKGHATHEHSGEDADLYRFLDDTERYFGIEISRVVEGRDIWQVMKDARCITMQQYAPCSKHLKRDPINHWIARTYGETPTTRVFGMEWHEVDRMERLQASLAPVPVWFPLAEPPYMDKCHIEQLLQRLGIKAPRLYELGFEHNNCGGFCVKAGQAHFARLWRTMPDRYRYHEGKEQEMRDYLDNDIAILKEQRDGIVYPLTLREFRGRLERGEKFNKHDFGGCGCFAPVPQLRMDDLVLEAGTR